MIDYKDCSFWIKNRLFRNKATHCYQEALSQQNLTGDQLGQLNWKKRKKIIEHVYHHIPFYHQYYKNIGFHPDNLKHEQDWELVPVLEKQMIRDHTLSLIDQTVAKTHLRSSTTGGSTGVPLNLYHDMRFPYEILSWRMLSWWGVSPGCDKAQVWRIPNSKKSISGKLKDFLVWWPTSRIFIDASILDEHSIQQFVKEINKMRPEIILGYVGAIEQIALFIKHHQITVVAPKLVWATSAPMSQVQRELFSQVFHSPVLDQYGSCEVMWIASNCPHNENLHLYADYRHVDILDVNDCILPHGNMGNIAITDLENYAFPLIKYKNGDRSSLLHETCSCGITLPLMSPIKGRESECVRLPDKSVIAGDYLTTVFDDYTQYIEQFQIVQREDYSISINVVLNPHLSSTICLEKISAVIDTLELKTKKQVSIKMNPVEKIPDDRGKIRYIVCEVPQY